jgi:hypothetical protein
MQYTGDVNKIRKRIGANEFTTPTFFNGLVNISIK